MIRSGGKSVPVLYSACNQSKLMKVKEKCDEDRVKIGNNGV